jgi:hypothetical protein
MRWASDIEGIIRATVFVPFTADCRGQLSRLAGGPRVLPDDNFQSHCTWSVVLVERTSEPVEGDDVPVTVMVYAPAGVPGLPPLLPLPPQAT